MGRSGRHPAPHADGAAGPVACPGEPLQPGDPGRRPLRAQPGRRAGGPRLAGSIQPRGPRVLRDAQARPEGPGRAEAIGLPCAGPRRTGARQREPGSGLGPGSHRAGPAGVRTARRTPGGRLPGHRPRRAVRGLDPPRNAAGPPPPVPPGPPVGTVRRAPPPGLARAGQRRTVGEGIP
ncbi:hypothetical protein ACFFX0_27965 [Citricoccus parietis]|uniref:Uncharacterized protein n=1 Tax=Citricoccus parietis TaxID=592307 RepID=A0ABV5G8R9_9MICC